MLCTRPRIMANKAGVAPIHSHTIPIGAESLKIKKAKKKPPMIKLTIGVILAEILHPNVLSKFCENTINTMVDKPV